MMTGSLPSTSRKFSLQSIRQLIVNRIVLCMSQSVQSSTLRVKVPEESGMASRIGTAAVSPGPIVNGSFSVVTHEQSDVPPMSRIFALHQFVTRTSRSRAAPVDQTQSPNERLRGVELPEVEQSLQPASHKPKSPRQTEKLESGPRQGEWGQRLDW